MAHTHLPLDACTQVEPQPAPAPFAQYTSLVGRSITSPSGPRHRLAFRRVLGVGAYGVVYLAEDIERQDRRHGWFSPDAYPRHERQNTITAGRMYAVKVMRCAPLGSRQRAFQAREVALHKRADGHPGVVPLHAVYGTGPPVLSRRHKSSRTVFGRPGDQLVWDRDAELSGAPLPMLDDGTQEELVYMVLSYVGGGDLFSMISERQRYVGHDALATDVFLQLLDAVAWCHEHGVKHRDLKPENILCDDDGRTVLISDFGLATTDRYSRDFGCGSSYYMSPECYGDPLTPATSPNYDTLANDVWTLGIVLVNLTTGRNPWEAASPADPTFKSFCASPSDFLLSILPLTPEANYLFTRVFERDQTKRCGLDELRALVLGVGRWTLRGDELDGASEGARDVALGCGLMDQRNATFSYSSSGGSSDMAQRSRFSEDTVDEEEMHWYDVIPPYTSPRCDSACSHASLDMARSRPVSKILSHSPQLASEAQFVLVETRPESVPRWPKIVQGWDREADEPTTPPRLDARFEDETPRPGPQTPKMPGTPRLGLPGLGSPFQSRIPRYTGAPLAISGSAHALSSKVSASTVSLASSQSSAFPQTPMKSQVVLSPTAPSDAKLWDLSRSSKSSLGSQDPAFEPGAPLFDPSARVFEARHRNQSWGASAVPSYATLPRRRYRTAGEEGLVYARRRPGSGSPKQRKVKRVPVPPIPSELLEEHERQLSARSNPPGMLHGDKGREMSPPPGLVLEDRQVGRKRLLENARAWFRRM